MIALLAIIAVASAADRDGDGIGGHDDLCPRDAETINGYKDGDGCPDGGKIQVRVLDSDGKPVEGASISIERPALPPGASYTPSTMPPLPQGSGPYAAEAIGAGGRSVVPAPPDRGFTNAAGAWTATGLAPGARVVIATAAGRGGRHDVAIIDGETADVIVTVGL